MRESFGVELISLYHDVLCGKNPKITLLKKQPFAIVSPFPSTSGKLKKINDSKIKDAISSYYHHENKANPGDQIGPASDGYLAPMSIQLKSTTTDDILSDIHQISRIDDLFMYENES